MYQVLDERSIDNILYQVRHIAVILYYYTTNILLTIEKSRNVYVLYVCGRTTILATSQYNIKANKK